MAEMLFRSGALTDRQAPRGVQLSELKGVTKIDLRGDPADREFMSAVGRVLDLVLPTEACSSIKKDTLGAFWLGPDQWLITGSHGDGLDLRSKLEEGLSSVHASVTDISAGRVAFRLKGPNARDVLAKGCPLDLHPRVVKPGHVAGSVLAKISALIHLQNDNTIDLYAGRSYADYLWAWLEEASLEYGMTVADAPTTLS